MLLCIIDLKIARVLDYRWIEEMKRCTFCLDPEVSELKHLIYPSNIYYSFYLFLKIHS